jgi:hypothetical protein
MSGYMDCRERISSGSGGGRCRTRIRNGVHGHQLTYQQIAVPETLLKKRRTTEASREAKLQAASEARQVSHKIYIHPNPNIPQHNDAKHNHQFQASRDYAAELTIFRV